MRGLVEALAAIQIANERTRDLRFAHEAPITRFAWRCSRDRRQQHPAPLSTNGWRIMNSPHGYVGQGLWTVVARDKTVSVFGRGNFIEGSCPEGSEAGVVRQDAGRVLLVVSSFSDIRILPCDDNIKCTVTIIYLP